MNDILHAYNLAKKWLPPIREQDKIMVLNILNGEESTFGTHILKKYLIMLKPYTEILGISGKYNKPRDADCIASGLIFFYGCLIYIMHFPKWGDYIEDIFLYNLLYILVDFYIDDIKINKYDKNIAISQMFILIITPLEHENIVLIDPILKTIAMIYYKLITRCPSAKDSIIKLFKAEIEGFTIQNNNNLERDEYYNICLKKGGYTMQVLQHIVGNIDQNIFDASYHIGTIMQLIDDSLAAIGRVFQLELKT